ncbi:MAG: acyltransferase [Muribaculum sp.]|nr:acyltransferase [Muribaculum sp.]
MNSKPRIGWIDWGKFLGILCVALIHVHAGNQLDCVLKTLDMSSLFFISGYLCSLGKYPSYKGFVRHRFNRIMIPYLVLSVVSMIVYALYNYVHQGTLAGVDFQKLIWVTLTGVSAMYPHNVPLWSLPCFFVMCVMFYPLGRTDRGVVWILLLSVVATTILSVSMGEDASMLPFWISQSMAAMVYFSLGNLVRRKKESFSEWLKGGWLWCAVFLAVVLFSVGVHFNQKPQFLIFDFGNIALFLMASVSGFFILLQISRWLSGRFGVPELVRFISSETLLICGLHWLLLPVVYKFLRITFNLSSQFVFYDRGLAVGLGIMLVDLTLTLGVIICYRRISRHVKKNLQRLIPLFTN